MVSTIAMVQLGKVYENLMVDVNTGANAKLVDRGTRIIQTVTGLPRDDAAKLLQAAGGHVKIAMVMHAHHISRSAAEDTLNQTGGLLSEIISTTKADGQ